jgi:drug/metabolite transporter (DMT)-like permease
MPPLRSISPRTGLLLVVLFWAGNFTAAKIAFEDLDPSAFTALRFMIASVVLWGVVRWVEGPAPLPRGTLWPLIWLGVIGNTVYQVLFMEGLDRTSATKSSLILAGMPALVTLSAGMLGIEKVTATQRIAVIVATIGVAIVVLGHGGSMHGGIGLGELYLLGSVVMWAAFTLMLRHWTLPMSSLNLTAWTLYTGTPGLVLIGLPALYHTHWQHISLSAWSGLAYSALLSLVAAYVFWNDAVAKIGAAHTVVYNTIVPLVATVIAMIALHERPGLVHIIGGLLIVSGVILTARGRAPEG